MLTVHNYDNNNNNKSPKVFGKRPHRHPVTPHGGPFPLGDLVPHRIHGSLDPHESAPQMGSRSVWSFLTAHSGAQHRKKDRQTDRHYSM